MRKHVFGIITILCTAALFSACAKKDNTTNSLADKVDQVVLGQYKELTYTPLDTTVTDEQVDNDILTNLLKANAESIDITDRAVKEGDFVNIDYEGLLDGTAFEGGSNKGYVLEIGSNSFLDGFEDGLIGIKKGEEVSLNLTFPEGYKNPDLSGKAVVFNVKVNSIQEKKLPELTDGLVKEKTESETVAEYKTATKAKLETTARENAELRKKNDLLEAAINNSKFDMDLTEEIALYRDNEKAYNEEFAKSTYDISAQELFNLIYGMDEAAYNSYLDKSAQNKVKLILMLSAIVKAENLTLTETEYQENLKQIFEGQTEFTDIDDMESNYGKDYFHESILNNMAQDIIFNTAVAADRTTE